MGMSGREGRVGEWWNDEGGHLRRQWPSGSSTREARPLGEGELNEENCLGKTVLLRSEVEREGK